MEGRSELFFCVGVEGSFFCCPAADAADGAKAGERPAKKVEAS